MFYNQNSVLSPHHLHQVVINYYSPQLRLPHLCQYRPLFPNQAGRRAGEQTGRQDRQAGQAGRQAGQAGRRAGGQAGRAGQAGRQAGRQAPWRRCLPGVSACPPSVTSLPRARDVRDGCDSPPPPSLFPCGGRRDTAGRGGAMRYSGIPSVKPSYVPDAGIDLRRIFWGIY